MTSSPKIKKLREILSRVGSVKSLAEASVRLARLDKLVKASLPSLMADYCHVKSSSTRELVIEAYSQAVATHLRFSAPKLLERLRSHEELKKLEVITVRVGTLPQKNEVNTPKARPHRVSEENCELLRHTAESMPNEDLKAALSRLARTLDRQRKH